MTTTAAVKDNWLFRGSHSAATVREKIPHHGINEIENSQYNPALIPFSRAKIFDSFSGDIQ